MGEKVTHQVITKKGIHTENGEIENLNKIIKEAITKGFTN